MSLWQQDFGVGPFNIKQSYFRNFILVSNNFMFKLFVIYNLKEQYYNTHDLPQNYINKT